MTATQSFSLTVSSAVQTAVKIAGLFVDFYTVLTSPEAIARYRHAIRLVVFAAFVAYALGKAARELVQPWLDGLYFYFLDEPPVAEVAVPITEPITEPIAEPIPRFQEMRRDQLRVECRKAGIVYRRLNKAGMIAALERHYS